MVVDVFQQDSAMSSCTVTASVATGSSGGPQFSVVGLAGETLKWGLHGTYNVIQ